MGLIVSMDFFQIFLSEPNQRVDTSGISLCAELRGPSDTGFRRLVRRTEMPRATLSRRIVYV